MEERIKQIKEKNRITELFSLSPSGFKGDRVFLSENFKGTTTALFTDL